MKKKKIIWSERARESLKDHYDYIKQDSIPAARRVKTEIIKATKGLNVYPDKFQLDEYYPDNPGNIRRFFRWSYRIIYQVNEKSIDILNVIHTSQEPTQD